MIGDNSVDIFSFIALLGGLAFFLYGMNIMSDGLEKSTNGKLNKYLSLVTKNKFLALLFGAGMTIAVQSSSAVTVMLVGLVNSGILEFQQTIGVLMGSNIGTTFTAWILSLAGIDSDVVWINLLKPKNFSPLFAFFGILMVMVAKKEKTKNTGHVLLGFAVLMFGMNMMGDAMEPLSEMPEFQKLLTAFTNPFLAVAVGAIFTGIIQSSAASVAILQAFSLTGGLTYGMAIPVIMGQNIGTCVTAVLSSIGVTRNAKKVAVVHLSFNIIGTTICLIPFCLGRYLLDWPLLGQEISPFMIAIVHSIFNVFTTLILLPFSGRLEWIANKVIPDIEEDDMPKVLLDDRLFNVPSMAVEKSFDTIVDMCKLSKKTFLRAIKLINEYDEKVAGEISNMESRLDHFEDQLGTYMMKLSQIGVSEEESKSVAKILHTIDDFERIGDHAMNIVAVAEELNEKKLSFSPKAQAEIQKITDAITEIMNVTVKAFETSDVALAKSVEPLEEVVDDLIAETKRRHISRLQNGSCTIELGFVLSDLLTSCERVSDHCSNVAAAIIESQHGTFETHEYLDHLKHKESFQRQYEEYSKKFGFET